MQSLVMASKHGEHEHKGRAKRLKKYDNLSRYGKWYRRWHELLVRLFGGKCVDCGISYLKEDLEFSHIGKTPLSGAGEGRGSYNRIKDILDNPEQYRLRCNDCHSAYDGREGKE